MLYSLPVSYQIPVPMLVYLVAYIQAHLIALQISSFIKTIEKIWEYEQKIDAKINRLVDLRAAINAAIESMEKPEERLLLKYRYLKNESWEDISYDLNVSYRTVHRIHASALNNFVVPE